MDDGKKAITMGLRKALKKLKRQFRRKRAWLLAGLLLAVVGAWLGHALTREHVPAAIPGGDVQPVHAAAEDDSSFEVVLHKRFLCGEEYESLGFHSEAAAEQMLRDHPDWQLEGIDGGRLVYVVEVADFSASCRDRAYFGLDGNNSLALFEGKPGEGRIIKTFFQIDVEHLANSLPRETVAELFEGIKVTDYAEYSSVLSTFSDFALPGAEQV